MGDHSLKSKMVVSESEKRVGGGTIGWRIRATSPIMARWRLSKWPEVMDFACGGGAMGYAYIRSSDD